MIWQVKSIRSRLIIAILMITGISMVVGLGISSYQDIKTYREDLKYQATILTQIVGDYCVSIMDFRAESGAEEILSKLKATDLVVGARLIDREGNFFYGYGKFELLSGLETQDKTAFKHDYLFVSKPLYFQNKYYGFIQMVFSTSIIQKKIYSQGVTLVIILLITFGFTFFASVKIQKSLHGPIFNLVTMANEVSEKGDYSLRITKQAEDEVGSLYSSFNNMLEVIENRENRLKQREENFRNIFNSQHDAIFIHDNDGTILDVNDTMLKMYRVSREEALRLKIVPDYSSTDNNFKKVDAIWEKTVQGAPQEFEWKARRPGDGSTFDVQVNLRRVEHQGTQTILATIRDITERKEMERGLKESEEKFRNLVEHLHDAVYVATEKNLVLVNNKFRELLEIDKEHQLGSAFSLQDYLNPRDNKVFKEQIALLESGEIKEAQLQISVHPEVGRERQIEATFSFTKIQNEKALQGILRDITDRKNLEEQFRQSQKMEAVGRLAGGIAHDFNNILTVINGYSDMLLKRKNLDPKTKKPLEQIRQSGVRAARLTNQLLAFSRKQVLRPKTININREIAELYSMLVRLIGENIHIDTDFSENIYPISIDLSQLEQITINIIINARDAMPDGGRLTIETQNIFFDGSKVEKHLPKNAGDFVMLTISDTGFGMDEKTKARIFEPFFSTKDLGKGTGLGLSMVYGIMNHIGGFISVYSEQGVGTTFKCYFPIAQEPETLPVHPVENVDETTLSGAETLLIVEDNKDLREFLRNIFLNLDYDFHLAEDGKHALDVISKNPHFDLLLTDVVMPNMSGPALLNQIAPRYKDLRVLFMSGYTGNEVIEDKLSHKYVDFIQKPFSSTQLLKKIRKLLDLP